MVGLLWPLAVVSFWFVVFVSANLLAVRFTRVPDAAPDQTRGDEAPVGARGVAQHVATDETEA
jgi:hypothetical protein